MAKSITIELSDAAYEAVREAAEAAQTTPEQLIASAVLERFACPDSAQTPFRQSVATFRAALRDRGLLVEPSALSPSLVPGDFPAAGSTAEAKLIQEIGDELSDAIERSGLSMTDLIERR